MNTHDYQIVKIGLTIDSSNNALMATNGAATAVLHITSTSSLAGVWEGTMHDLYGSDMAESDADWFALPSLIINTSGVTKNLPGATVTPTDDDQLAAACTGARFVRFRRTAGDGTGNMGLTQAQLSDIATSAGASGTVDTEMPAAAALADNASNPTAPAVGAFEMQYDPDTPGWDRVRSQVQCYSFIPDGTDELLISADARFIWGVDVFTIDATPVYVKLYDKATAPAETDTPVHRTGVPANSTAANGAGNNKGVWTKPVPVSNGLGVRAVTGIADNNDSALTASENLINVYWSK